MAMLRALIISADGFEDSELLVPYYRLQEAGLTVEVAAQECRPIVGKHGYQVQVDRPVSDLTPAHYGILLLPGGTAPALLRRDETVLAFCRAYAALRRPLAAICHGPQVLISAGVMKGRRATCYRTVADELKAAGALYMDCEVVVDDNLITSRQPADLPAFTREIVRLLGAY